MRAIICTKYGSPEVLALQEVEKPVPGDEEILIKIFAATVTAGDCELRRFDFPLWFWLPFRIFMGLRKPRMGILGQELAGEIEAVGKDVRRFRKGDRVFAPTDVRFGACAEYRCFPEGHPMALKPANMSFGEAAALPTGGLNALHYLRQANIGPGDTILIIGAAGNMGGFAVQLAKYFGAEVTAVDSGPKLGMLRALGADQVIDYTREDFTKTGESYDVIFNVLGQSFIGHSLKLLTPNGRYLLINPRMLSMLQGLWTSATSSRKVIMAFANYKSEDLVFLKELVDAGKLKSVIDRRYALEDTADAHAYVESGQKIGNVVINVAHDDND